jgi:hypothetical protein
MNDGVGRDDECIACSTRADWREQTRAVLSAVLGLPLVIEMLVLGYAGATVQDREAEKQAKEEAWAQEEKARAHEKAQEKARAHDRANLQVRAQAYDDYDDGEGWYDDHESYDEYGRSN